MLIGLLVGGGVLVLGGLVCAGVFTYILLNARSASRTQEPVASRAAAPNNNPAPPPANNNPAPPPANNNPPPGNPPPNQPMPGPGANPPGDQEGSIVLSNPRVFRRGLRIEISVDYKWAKGGPSIGQHLFVIVKSPRGTGEANIFPTHVHNEGTFNLQELGGFAAGERGPFEIYVETGLPGPFSPRKRISNTVTAN